MTGKKPSISKNTSRALPAVPLLRNAFEISKPAALAVIRLFEIIGEAARNLSQEIRDNHPEIAWKQITGTRDRLIHGYFDVDLDIIQTILTRDLPFSFFFGKALVSRGKIIPLEKQESKADLTRSPES